MGLGWWYKFRGCQRKQTFESMKQANSAARGDSKRYGVKMRAYKCRYCAQFHLTSKPDRKPVIVQEEELT